MIQHLTSAPPDTGSLEVLQLRVAALESQLSDLIERAQPRPKRFPPHPDDPIEPFGLAIATERVRKFTESLIPGKHRLELCVDPEFGDCKICFEVEVSGTVEELANWNSRWCRQVTGVAQEYCFHFVLSLTSAE